MKFLICSLLVLAPLVRGGKGARRQVRRGEEGQPGAGGVARNRPFPPAPLRRRRETGITPTRRARGGSTARRPSAYRAWRRSPRAPEADAARQQEADLKSIHAVEDGDVVRFERKGPFGVYKWSKPKKDLNEMERKAWEGGQTKRGLPRRTSRTKMRKHSWLRMGLASLTLAAVVSAQRVAPPIMVMPPPPKEEQPAAQTGPAAGPRPVRRAGCAGCRAGRNRAAGRASGNAGHAHRSGRLRPAERFARRADRHPRQADEDQLYPRPEGQGRRHHQHLRRSAAGGPDDADADHPAHQRRHHRQGRRSSPHRAAGGSRAAAHPAGRQR